MHWPSWDANTSALIQALAAIAQGALTILALLAAIAVPGWQHRQSRADDKAARADELAGLRQALHTEIGMVSLQCLAELNSWKQAVSVPAPKNVRTARLPALTIYEANAGKIGLLTRMEIVSLLSFAGSLHDISIVVDDMARQAGQGPASSRPLMALLANACGAAARFLEAVPGIEGGEDAAYIKTLTAAWGSSKSERLAAREALLAPNKESE